MNWGLIDIVILNKGNSKQDSIQNNCNISSNCKFNGKSRSGRNIFIEKSCLLPV